ncbi:TfoX/Sxy family protein [bacterium]|nr:TfoX/Sxy family protein [bacterium]
MAYDLHLAERIRNIFAQQKLETEEKKMMGGLCYMLNDKMCVGVVKDELMARINPELYEKALTKPGASEMNFTRRAMKGYVFVNGEGTDKEEDLEFWVNLAIEFNPLAKSSKKKKKA